MGEYRTVNIKKQVYQQLEEQIKDKPYESVKDLMLHGARNELNKENIVQEITQKVIKQIKEKLDVNIE